MNQGPTIRPNTLAPTDSTLYDRIQLFLAKKGVKAAVVVGGSALALSGCAPNATPEANVIDTVAANAATNPENSSDAIKTLIELGVEQYSGSVRLSKDAIIREQPTNGDEMADGTTNAIENFDGGNTMMNPFVVADPANPSNGSYLGAADVDGNFVWTNIDNVTVPIDPDKIGDINDPTVARMLCAPNPGQEN